MLQVAPLENGAAPGPSNQTNGISVVTPGAGCVVSRAVPDPICAEEENTIVGREKMLVFSKTGSFGPRGLETVRASRSSVRVCSIRIHITSYSRALPVDLYTRPTGDSYASSRPAPIINASTQSRPTPRNLTMFTPGPVASGLCWAVPTLSVV